MRTVNPTRSFVLEHNMTQQLSCDAISIPEWKLELMAKSCHNLRIIVKPSLGRLFFIYTGQS